MHTKAQNSPTLLYPVHPEAQNCLCTESYTYSGELKMTKHLLCAAACAVGLAIAVSPAFSQAPVAAPAKSAKGAKAGAKAAPATPVDLNTASQAELESIPGIGAA